MFGSFEIIELHDFHKWCLRVESWQKSMGPAPEKDELTNDGFAVNAKVQRCSTLGITSGQKTKNDGVQVAFLLPKAKLRRGFGV